MAELVVYTAIFGSEVNDALPLARPDSSATRFVCFTDRKPPRGGEWEYREPFWRHPNPRRTARFHKTNPHQLFPQASYSLWMDGNFTLKRDLESLIAQYLAGADIASFRHRQRTCIYEEYAACARLKKDSVSLMSLQMERYKQEGYPPYQGLAETGVVLRRHGQPVIDFNQLWWKELSKGSLRDQLSFNYCLWWLKLPCVYFSDALDRSPDFTFTTHR